MYTCTPDGDYILDTLPSNRNIVVAAGFNGQGFKMGPLIGKILMQMALEVNLSEDAKNYLQYFRFSRFL